MYIALFPLHGLHHRSDVFESSLRDPASAVSFVVALS